MIYVNDEKIFLLNTRNFSYAFKIDAAGNTAHLYSGAAIDSIGDLPTLDELTKKHNISFYPDDDMQEYRGFGGYSYSEPAIKARMSDGTRNLFLKYHSHTINSENAMELVLKDRDFDFYVTLKYELYPDFDIIKRSVSIRNNTGGPVHIEKCYSASYTVPDRDRYRLRYLSGSWSAEYIINDEIINCGNKVLETRTGLSGPDHPPFFMLYEDDRVNENYGEVFFYTLAYSGNWKAVINKEYTGRIKIVCGINDFDFELYLTDGESFETPEIISGFSDEGFGGVSRKLHDYERNEVMLPVERERISPVAYNVYGTYAAHIDETKLLSLVDRVADIGADLFIVDDGWQGYGAADTDGHEEGYGEWNVNPDRFPNGLKPLADKVHKRNMMFGLWLQPEVVRTTSKLVKEHPEWILQYKSRGLEAAKGRYYTLDFSRKDVRDYMMEKICKLIDECDIDYFKTDFTGSITCMGQYEYDKYKSREITMRYAQGITDFYMEIKRRYSNILFENCASGGGRADINTLKYSGRINRSDNQDPYDVLNIHEGFSYFMLPKLAGGGCHISDALTFMVNNRVSPLEYQAHCGMLGSLGISIDLNKKDHKYIEKLKSYVEQYKSIRHLVSYGDIYRLASAREKNYAAFLYAAKDKSEAVLFYFGKICNLVISLKG